MIHTPSFHCASRVSTFAVMFSFCFVLFFVAQCVLGCVHSHHPWTASCLSVSLCLFKKKKKKRARAGRRACRLSRRLRCECVHPHARRDGMHSRPLATVPAIAYTSSSDASGDGGVVRPRWRARRGRGNLPPAPCPPRCRPRQRGSARMVLGTREPR